LGSGDEIQVPLASNQVGTEIHVRKNAASRFIRELYEAPIGYVTRPKEDKRKDLFVTAEVLASGLGIKAIHLPCHVLRDYFYLANRQRECRKQPTLYDVVRIHQSVGPGELRLSFKIRSLSFRRRERQRELTRRSNVPTTSWRSRNYGPANATFVRAAKYLFREEYIFDVGGVVVETPQIGHATYLFAKPASMESFLAL
jgi:hypothetical protein